MDLRHSDSILIMGSNMAECHPVAFRFVVDAKTRRDNPCTVIHADPRFTRTSALADVYAPLRAGSDIAFLGALVRETIDRLEPILHKDEARMTERDRFHRDYLVCYTNAATLVNKDFTDTEANDLAGLFAGYDPNKHGYDVSKWRYDNSDQGDSSRTIPGRQMGDEHGQKPPAPGAQQQKSLSEVVKEHVVPRAKTDASLRDPRCVFQLLKAHFARYTPELVEEVCGTPREVFHQVADALWANAGPDHSGAICYAVGWTQHTTGVQIIRTAAILQLLLGNVGRPGGGIIALRGHATIQGSTDIATLYDLLPGYLKMPSALRKQQTLAEYVADQAGPTSYWSNFPKFIVSLLRAWYGDAGGAKDFGFELLPQITGDHSHMPTFVEMMKGNVKGYFAIGQNPAVGGQNASFQRQALAKLDWLVVRDLYETETASFWKDSPEVKNGTLKPEEIRTEVFFLPAAGVAESDGSFTNTQRLVQYHDKAADPPGDCRSDIWFTVDLGLRLRKLYEGSTLPRDKPIRYLTWDYIDPDANKEWRIADEPSAELILKEINGFLWKKGERLKDATPVPTFAALQDDGSTACGGWVYSGIFAPTPEQPLGHNHAANRNGSDDWVALGWGFSWPANRRVMYNRCSADLHGNPWPKEARLAKHFAPRDGKTYRGYVYWDPAQKKWTGLDIPDFIADKSPQAEPDPNGVGVQLHDGRSPFIMQADGKGWLYVPTGLKDGPFPTHYEPYESPVANAVYKQQSNPTTITWDLPPPAWGPTGNVYARIGGAEYPHMVSTYRLTEHHLSGVMSRWLPWLSELMPELFCEISPEHAAELGVANTGWVRIHTPRGSVRAKALVTRRIRPFRIQGRVIHHVGLPWHWGYKGVSTGDVVNDLAALVGEPNVTIHEAKIFVCNVTRLTDRGTDHARTRRLLHRYDRLHRLQGVPGGLPPVERPAGRARAGAAAAAGPQRPELRQHRQPLGRQLAARQVHRAVQPRPPAGRLADDVGRLQALRPRPLPGGLPDRGDPADRVRHRLHQRAGVQRLPRLHLRLPVRRHPRERDPARRPEVHLLLRPPQGRPRPGLRPGLPDRLDPLRPPGQAQGAGPGPRRAAPRPRPDRGPPLRGRRPRPRRAQRLLPAHGRAGGLRPAVEPQGAEQDRAGVDVLERLHRPARRAGGAVPLPRTHPVRTGRARPGGGPAVNFFVADPDWGFWIIVYFYLGGIAAGGYFLAVLIEWFGRPEDHALARIAYRLAFPLVLICTVALIVDLGRPGRFWHMVLKSEVVKEAFAAGFPFSLAGWRLALHTPMFKYYSPMSSGSWGLSVFGACSFLSFVATLWPDTRVGRWLHIPWVNRALQIVGLVSAFYIASYTGALLSATNQPLWSDTVWLSPLFLASAVSTGLAALLLIGWWRDLGTPAARDRLASSEPLVLGLELAVLGAFAASLGDDLFAVLMTVRGNVMIFGTLALGIVVPFLLNVRVGHLKPWGLPATAACVLVGGLLLRYGVVTTPGEILRRGPEVASRFAPEEHRRHGEPGADPGNHPPDPEIQPRTKLPGLP
jgi:formate dehydrogenase major subunit